MTHTQTTYINRIALRAGKKGVRPAEVGALAPVFEKLANNVSEETELIAFYGELSSLVRRIPKHNVIVIVGDMTAQIGKNGNNKYSLRNTSNRNGQHLTDFMIENRLTCLNTNYQKRWGEIMDLHIRKQ